jgi:hypothetical protein
VTVGIALAMAPTLLPPDPPRPRAAGLDVRGAVLATAGVTLASYGFVETQSRGWSSPRVVAPLAVGLALAATFLLLERRGRDPLLPPAFPLNPQRALGLAGIALTAAGSGLVFFLMPLGFQQERGWSPLRTSGAFLPYAVALLAASVAARPLIARCGARPLMAAGLIIGATGLADLAAGGVHAPYLSVVLPGLPLFPVGAALSFAGSTVLTLAEAPPDRAGMAAGVMNTAMELGPTAGLAMLLALSGFGRPLAAAGTCLAATAMAALTSVNRLLGHRRRHPRGDVIGEQREQFQRPHVLLDLLGPAGAGDDRGHPGVAGAPGDSQRRERHAE